MDKNYELTICDFHGNNYRRVSSGIYVHESIKDLNQPIFRYMLFEHLLGMLSKKRLYVSNRSSFNDLSEHGWKENLKYISPFSSVGKGKTESSRTYNKWKASYNICISCWTYDKHYYVHNMERECESYLMWKAYNTGGIGCRIETTLSDLIERINVEKKHDILISEVSYIDEHRSGNIHNDIFSKPRYYQDEQEIRLCVLSQEKSVLLDIDPLKLIKGILISPFISNEYSRFIISSLKNTYPEWNIPIEKSHIMEHF